ncbi:NmrA family NAD(P)-binding protein [Crenobacter sp. SG2303]|uniref:NmrA family NAD(P)-binding protein n=1 Tax=Crenobacter oryzisoli TaxID=3056844 RepID=A0ABT7XQP6_9NEIS|nr:NmrA family NAD(P)-binding protein [Crenobacter sp. SG2303]MDN0076114.1 NmrA family NAD(P)-binding protein [Crenobacter sp. SG2303]
MPFPVENQHLVLGASGAQGAAIAKELLERGERVKGLVRSERSVLSAGIERAVADLGDPASLVAAFAGVTNATITLPLVYDPTIIDSYAQNIASAALAAGVQRLVFNANIRTPAQMSGVAGFDTRLSAERILRASGIPMVCLQPAVYLENLLAPSSIVAMQQRGELHYPLPADMEVSWISHTDLAKAVCIAHRIAVIPEQAIAIGSAPVTGKELAAALADSLGRPLNYCSLDPAVFETAIAGLLGTDAAAGIAGIYHWAFHNPASTLFKNGAVELRQKLDITALTPSEWAQRRLWQPAGKVAANRPEALVTVGDVE